MDYNEEYTILSREILDLKRELRITHKQRIQSESTFSRLVEQVMGVPEPLIRGGHQSHTSNSILSSLHLEDYISSSSSSLSPRGTFRNSLDFRRRSYKRDSKKIFLFPPAFMDNHIWGTVFSFLDFRTLISVCTVCQRFNEIVHSTVQHILDEQRCLYEWFKHLDAIPKASPWLPSAAAIMPLYLFPSWGFSFKSKEKKTAEKNHKNIEDEIKKQRRRKKTRTQLVVGPSGSGKTTYINRFLCPSNNNDNNNNNSNNNNNNNNNNQLPNFVEKIREYTITSMRDFLFKSNQDTKEDITLELIVSIWKDPSIQQTYNETQKTTNNAKYFFEKAEIIRSNEYIPTQGDLLRLYMKEERPFTEFIYKNNDLVFETILAQNFMANSKLFHGVFSNVDSIFICISLPDLDQENESYIRDVATKQFFNGKCVLVLTKLDIFTSNLLSFGTLPAASVFVNYTGDKTSVKDVLTHISARLSEDFKFQEIKFVNNVD